MKKLLILLGVTLVIMSCAYDEYHRYTIENRSVSRAVSFTFNDEPVNLPAGESITKIVNSWDNYTTISSESVNFTIGHDKSIRLNRSGFTFFFEDVPQRNLSVINTLPIPVTLTTAYLEGGALTIPATYTETSIIYTDNPDFYVSPSGFPINVDINFTGDTVNVIIR